MEPQFRAAAGAAAWQISNPPILAAAPLVASLALFLEAGGGAPARQVRGAHRLVSISCCGRLRPPCRSSPRTTPRARGCQLSLRLASGAHAASACSMRLSARGMVCDWRSPDIIRVAPVPLYNRFEDVWQFAQALRALLQDAA